jgi:hypothetical protein
MGREGLQGCDMLKIPHCLDDRITDGREVVSLTHRSRFIPRHVFIPSLGTLFYWAQCSRKDYKKNSVALNPQANYTD